jgi:hypothetical protein
MGASFFAILSSVIVGYLNVNRTILGPNETDPELIVDPNRMLAFPIAAQRFQPVAGRRSQVVELDCGVEVTKFTSRNRQNVGRNAFPAFAVKHGFRPRIPEAFDHRTNVSFDGTFVYSMYHG